MASTADPARRGDSIEAATEATPLLNAPESGGPLAAYNGNGKTASHQTDPVVDAADQAAEDELAEKPLPIFQIILLCVAGISEPIACFAIFPIINEMLQRTGAVPTPNLGFWAGLIESLFSIVQMCLMIFYGRMADRIGRKPVLVFSLVGISIATALFGLSRNLAQMVIFRCAAGLFAGTVLTIRTMLSENCTKYTQGRAFSWFMFVRNLGIFIGPLVGGSFADPAERFPSVFGHVRFFEEYPFALSSFVAGGLCLIGTVLNILFLKETLPATAGDKQKPAPVLSTWQVFRSPGVGVVLFIYAHVMLLSLAYTAVSPTFLYTAINDGGCSFTSPEIGYFIALSGASQALWMLFAFPPLQRRLGTGTVLRACSFAWPVFLAFFPIGNELLRQGQVGAFLGIGFPFLIIGSGISMSFACVQLCLNDVSPSPTTLATINSLALTLNSGVRAVAPALFTSIFAIGTKWRWAHGHLVWIILVILALALPLSVILGLPESAEGKLPPVRARTAASRDPDAGTEEAEA